MRIHHKQIVIKQSDLGAVNQQTETDLIATAMNKMAATVNDVASNAAEANNDASVRAQLVEKTILANNTLADRVNESSDKQG